MWLPWTMAPTWILQPCANHCLLWRSCNVNQPISNHYWHRNMYLEILCQLRNHTVSVTCTGYPIWNAKYSKPHWFWGYLSWLLILAYMAFTNSGLFRKWSVIIKNLREKGERSLVTRNIVKQTWPYQLYRRILHIKALLLIEFLISCNLKMF